MNKETTTRYYIYIFNLFYDEKKTKTKKKEWKSTSQFFFRWNKLWSLQKKFKLILLYRYMNIINFYILYIYYIRDWLSAAHTIAIETSYCIIFALYTPCQMAYSLTADQQSSTAGILDSTKNGVRIIFFVCKIILEWKRFHRFFLNITSQAIGIISPSELSL